MKMSWSEKGSVVLILAITTFMVVMILGAMFITRTKSSSRSALSETVVTQGIEIADVGIQQMLGDIHRRQSSVDPAALKRLRDKLEGNGYPGGEIEEISRYYQVKKSTSNSYLLWTTTATLSMVPFNNDPTTEKAASDIEDNPIFQIISRSTIFSLDGKEMGHKTVKANIAVINLAKYDILNIGTDRTGWNADYAGNIRTGFIHVNPQFCLNLFNFPNCQYLPFPSDCTNFTMGANRETFQARYYKNPYFSPKYTVVVGGHMKKLPWDNSDPPTAYRTFTQYGANTTDIVTSSITISQFEGTYARRAYYCHNYVGSPEIPDAPFIEPNYDIIATGLNPRGTWFDGEHGGFKVNVLPLDFTFFRSNADIIIEMENLNNCKIRNPDTGTVLANFDGNNLLRNLHDGPGATDRNAVEIDLGALGTGSPKDIFGAGSQTAAAAMGYYNGALDDDGDGAANDKDDNGLVIYVKGWVAIHGRLAPSNNANINQNKKITIVTSEGVNIIGDVIYSGDSYLQVLDPGSSTAGWTVGNGEIAVIAMPNPGAAAFNPSSLEYQLGGPKSLEVSMNRGWKEANARSSFVKTNCLVTAPTIYHNINDGTNFPFDVPDNKVTLNLYLGDQVPCSQANFNIQLSSSTGALIKELPNNNSEQIVINEICYAHPSGNTYQWVELYNRHPTRVYDLRNWQFFDGNSTLLINAGALRRGDWLLGPGEYAVLVRDWDDFNGEYNPANLAEDSLETDIISLGMVLNNNGIAGVRLIDPLGRQTEPTYFYVHPMNRVRWDTAGEGGGNSTDSPHPDWIDGSWERVNYYSTLPGIWQRNTNSAPAVGTPGRQNACFRPWARVIVTGLSATNAADLNEGNVSLIFTDYSKGTVSKSGNNGNTWPDHGLSTATVYALAIDPNDANRLYAGSGGMGVFRTTNGGNTWRRLLSNIALTNENVYCLAIDPTTADPALRLYAGTENGVYRSVDSGDNWGQLGLTTHTVYALAIDPGAVLTLYAGTRGDGLLKTINGGALPADWSEVGGGLPAGTTVQAISMKDSSGICIGTRGQGVYQTVDGATTWNPAATGLTVGTTIYTLTGEPGTDTIYAGTAGGIFRTTNKGVDWADITTTLPANTPIFSIAHKAMGNKLFVGTNDGLYIGPDDGSNWDVLNPSLSGSFVNALVTPGGNVFYAGTSDEINFDLDELVFSLGRSFPLNARFKRTTPGSANPANLYNDAIAIIANSNVSVDTWELNRRGHFGVYPRTNWDEDGRYVPPEYQSSRFFVNNGAYQVRKSAADPDPIYYTDMKISCFFYFNLDLSVKTYVRLNTPIAAKFLLNPSVQMASESFYGSTVSKGTSYGCAVGGEGFYDADLEENVSKIIPVGTGILSWQQVEGK
ncbi:MAG: hypothetical protein ABII74_01060 [Elusimicrobiota bacterium]